MNINQAFDLLGLDLVAFLNAMATKSLRQKKDVIESYLNLAKSHRKNLLGIHHPDRGGDPEKFRLIQQAYDFIEVQSTTAIESIEYKMATSNVKKVKVEIN